MENYGRKINNYGNKIVVKPYIDRIAEVMSKSDIVIARAGAGTVFELTALGCPAIYIPLKTASENHQYYNAMFAKKAGCALILDEDEAYEKGALIEKLNQIKANINVFRNKLEEIPMLDSTAIIFKEAEIE